VSFVEIHNLRVAFGKEVILDHFSLNLNEGEIYAVIGPSGCGKSTLLKAINGIIQPQNGVIRIKSELSDPKKHNIGYIPQHYGLLNWFKVKKNISIGENIKQSQNLQKDEIIKKLGLEELLERYPNSLSGGQKQRVALARAWILEPDLLLMDEPFSALDTFTAETSKNLFLNLWKQQKITTLFVTHNIQEAVQMGKHIVILSHRPAQIARIIENPLFQKGASRSHDDFYHFTQEVNGILNKIWNDSYE
jgi:NitT/TauT family transport system ATP-binding protein